MRPDAELLRDYAERGREEAFTEIVARHTNLVYSAALRQVGSPDAAAELAQEVFVGLARDAAMLAARLGNEGSIAGWLCRSARNLSLNHRRDEYRRRARERLAMEDLETTSEAEPDWDRLKVVLDDAMAELDEADYEAIVLRFFRDQDFRAVGTALGVSDDAAQKRVSRALEKLRGRLSLRGVEMTAAGLALILPAKAIHAAPAGLAASISSAAAQGAKAGALSVTKSVVMTTLQKLAVAAALAAAVGTGIYEARRASAMQEQSAALASERDALAKQLQEAREETARKGAAPEAVGRNGRGASGGDEHAEVARLRSQVDRLKDRLARAEALAQDPAAAPMASWLDRVKKLKEKLAEMPQKSIPEYRLLTDDDWLDAVRDLKHLESDADYEKAFQQLKSAARNEFATSVQGAFHAYAQANNGALPGDFSQLQSYFAQPMDDSILQGYEFSKPGVVASKPSSLVDEDGNYNSWQMKIGVDSVSSSHYGEDGLHGAIQSYLSANAGQTLTDPAQLLPYVSTPEEKAALQKIMQEPPKN